MDSFPVNVVNSATVSSTEEAINAVKSNIGIKFVDSMEIVSTKKDFTRKNW